MLRFLWWESRRAPRKQDQPWFPVAGLTRRGGSCGGSEHLLAMRRAELGNNAPRQHLLRAASLPGLLVMRWAGHVEASGRDALLRRPQPNKRRALRVPHRHGRDDLTGPVRREALCDKNENGARLQPTDSQAGAVAAHGPGRRASLPTAGHSSCVRASRLEAGRDFLRQRAGELDLEHPLVCIEGSSGWTGHDWRQHGTGTSCALPVS